MSDYVAMIPSYFLKKWFSPKTVEEENCRSLPDGEAHEWRELFKRIPRNKTTFRMAYEVYYSLKELAEITHCTRLKYYGSKFKKNESPKFDEKLDYIEVLELSFTSYREDERGRLYDRRDIITSAIFTLEDSEFSITDDDRDIILGLLKSIADGLVQFRNENWQLSIEQKN